MNNAKNEGSDASRLALALLKGTAVGIGAAAVLMPILALAAYSSPDPSKLTVYLGYAAFALAAAVPGSPLQNSPEAECFPARYRRRDCPCLFSPFLFSSTAEARPQPPYLPRFTSARSCSGRCPQQPRESASRKNARSTHRRRKHRADDRGKPYHSCGGDAL